jgi:hypothetical protein
MTVSLLDARDEMRMLTYERAEPTVDRLFAAFGLESYNEVLKEKRRQFAKFVGVVVELG